jgi:hypothetical protein
MQEPRIVLVPGAGAIINGIDRVLARRYGLTAVELDFIINHDINYRLGRDAGQEENE